MHSDRPTVVHISTVHSWTDNRIFRKICRSLARNGYQVTFLVSAPTRQTVDDVLIVPFESPRGRVARVLFNLPRVARRALAMHADVYHLHDPELIPLIPVLRLSGAKVIYDAHEDLGKQLLEKEYLAPAIRPLAAAAGRALCAFADRTANHVIAAAPKVAETFRADSCTVVRNYPEQYDDGSGTREYGERSNRAVYAGGLTRARGVEQMIDAIDHPSVPPDWRLLLVGPHSPADLIDRLRKRPGWSRVDYHGVLPPRDARALVDDCKIGLAVLQPIGQNPDVISTKLFEYMSSGIPIVAANYEQCRAIIEGSGCGMVVDPTDPEAIGKAIAMLAAQPEEAREMGRRGKEQVATTYNWKSEESRLLDAYARVLGGGPTRSA